MAFIQTNSLHKDLSKSPIYKALVDLSLKLFAFALAEDCTFWEKISKGQNISYCLRGEYRDLRSLIGSQVHVRR